MSIDLDPIKTAISSVLTGQGITPQVNASGSHLTIVLNRQHDQRAEYESLSQKIMDALRNIDIPGLDLIKFYGREMGKQPEWQTKTHLSQESGDVPPFSPSTSKAHLETQTQYRDETSMLVSQPIATPISVSQSTTLSKPGTGLNILMVLMSWGLFAVGIWMMLTGLDYSTSYRGTHNIGLISTKATYTNAGGYLTVSGAIFVHHFSSKLDRKK